MGSYPLQEYPQTVSIFFFAIKDRTVTISKMQGCPKRQKWFCITFCILTTKQSNSPTPTFEV